MADEIDAPPLSETPPPASAGLPGSENSPPPAHEPEGGDEFNQATPTEEKIHAATGSLFERLGFNFKRGRGRPKKDGSPKISDHPFNSDRLAELPGEVVATPAPDLDKRKSLIRRGAKVAFRALIATADKFIFSRAVIATGSRDIASQIVKENTATAEEVDAVGEIVEILGEMYGWDPRTMILIAGFTTLSGMGGRYGLTVSELSGAISRAKKAVPTPLKAI